MNDIEKTIHIAAPLERVWAALTDPKAIGAWMGDDQVQVDLKPGGRYAFFDGQTTGALTRIEAPQHLEYSWRQSEWQSAWGDSLVRWELRAAAGGVEVKLWHGQFPNREERDSHAEGWDIYFLGPMKEWLEADD